MMRVHNVKKKCKIQSVIGPWHMSLHIIIYLSCHYHYTSKHLMMYSSIIWSYLFLFPLFFCHQKRNGDTWPSEVGGKTEQHMWMTNQGWKKTEDLTQSSMSQYIIGFNYSICICIFIVIGVWSYGCPMDNV